MNQQILSPEQMKDIVREAVREEFRAIGLRVNDDDDADAAREDFRFIRKWRQAVDGAASKVGMAVILALVSGLMTIMWQGFKLVSGK